MNITFCIGNGPSRHQVNLNELKDVGPIYGCNGLIREFDLDNTIIVDKALLIEIVSEGYNKKTNIFTRRRWEKLLQADNLYFLDDPIINPTHKFDNEMHWGSGTHALNLAARNGADIVVMIGYDLYNSNFDPSCWIHQINKCLELYPDIQFVQIQDDNWQTPKNWTADNILRDNFNGLVQLLKDNQLT